ncbi:hypothetical protein JHK86_052115 [Glycine max]|nr:hypothetical protein JHK86_052115 [Glycine max]
MEYHIALHVYFVDLGQCTHYFLLTMILVYKIVLVRNSKKSWSMIISVHKVIFSSQHDSLHTQRSLVK